MHLQEGDQLAAGVHGRVREPHQRRAGDGHAVLHLAEMATAVVNLHGKVMQGQARCHPHPSQLRTETLAHRSHMITRVSCFRMRESVNLVG